MIVEDDIQTADTLKKTIEKLFYEVYVAYDGEEALKTFYEKKPDLLFVDIIMPKMNGLELIREIRKFDNEVKIIIISAHNTNEYLKEAIKLKLEDYLIKPISFDDFMDVLSTVANHYYKKHPNAVFLESGAQLHLFDKAIVFNNKRYNITKSEYKLLELLLVHKNHIVEKEMIESCLHYGGSMSDSALKGLVNKVRQKIGKNSIQAQSGYGYKIVVP